MSPLVKGPGKTPGPFDVGKKNSQQELTFAFSLESSFLRNIIYLEERKKQAEKEYGLRTENG